MEFFKSDDVKVFPCARRGAKTESGEIEKIFDAESRLNTEYNLTHLHGINGGTFYSYVHKYELNNDKTLKSGSILVVIVGGYYFEITLNEEYFGANGMLTKDAIAAENGTGVWLNVDLEDKNLDANNKTKLMKNLDNPSSDQLDEKVDNEYYFKGLKVSYAGDSKQEFSIQILDKDAHFIEESTKSISPDKIGLKSLFINKNSNLNPDPLVEYNGMEEINICPGQGIKFLNNSTSSKQMQIGLQVASSGGLNFAQDGLGIKIKKVDERNLGIKIDSAGVYALLGDGITFGENGEITINADSNVLKISDGHKLTFADAVKTTDTTNTVGATKLPDTDRRYLVVSRKADDGITVGMPSYVDECIYIEGKTHHIYDVADDLTPGTPQGRLINRRALESFVRSGTENPPTGGKFVTGAIYIKYSN